MTDSKHVVSLPLKFGARTSTAAIHAPSVQHAQLPASAPCCAAPHSHATQPTSAAGPKVQAPTLCAACRQTSRLLMPHHPSSSIAHPSSFSPGGRILTTLTSFCITCALLVGREVGERGTGAHWAPARSPPPRLGRVSVALYALAHPRAGSQNALDLGGDRTPNLRMVPFRYSVRRIGIRRATITPRSPSAGAETSARRCHQNAATCSHPHCAGADDQQH